MPKGLVCRCPGEQALAHLESWEKLCASEEFSGLPLVVVLFQKGGRGKKGYVQATDFLKSPAISNKILLFPSLKCLTMSPSAFGALPSDGHSSGKVFFQGH